MTVESALLKAGRLHGKPYKDRQGYLRAYDPRAKRARRVHRIVVEAHLGRDLSPDEMVHHKNHDRTDNRIENLEVMTKMEHLAEHGNLGPKVDVKCPVCGKVRVFYKQRADRTVHGACRDCKNVKTNETRTGHIVWFWVVWGARGMVFGPYATRRKAVEDTPLVARKSKTLVSSNNRTGVLKSGRDLPLAVYAEIRARSEGT